MIIQCQLSQTSTEPVAITELSMGAKDHLPAGTGTLIVFLWTVLPLPLHSTQGCGMCIRVPLHRRQVERITNGPVTADSHVT